MASQSNRDQLSEKRDDPSRSIRYKLKCELRRLQRHGRGETPYALAIREVLWALANGEDDGDLVQLLEREMDRPVEDDADEPYARPLRAVLSKLYQSQSSAHELFSYFLRRLESEGRGDEPFAVAVRQALASNDSSTLSSLLHGRADNEGNRE